MGTFNKSGQVGITNGKLGTTTNYSLGSTGTTSYSLNPNGGLVTLQWLISGSPFTQTIRTGDTIEQNWTLGSTGTTTYTMGAGNSKTIKYTLDPGGNITESNGKLSGKTGTASYTLGTGSSSQVKASLGQGSTQSYTLGTGGSSTIRTVINSMETNITLGPGDSVTTILGDGAEALLECSSVYDPDAPPVESMDYAVGDDGSTDNTFGDTTWQVWLFQPYNNITKVDYNPICVVMPKGEYTPGCPAQLPSFILNNGDYADGTVCRAVLIGSATYSGTTQSWNVTQNAIGTITIPTDDREQYDPNNPDLPENYVNQYEAKAEIMNIGGIDTWVLRIGRGGNIWNPSTENQQHALEKRVDEITVGPGINPVSGGGDWTSPWASDGGRVVLSSGSNTYVYAYKITYNQGYTTDFYIYVSQDDDLIPESGKIDIPAGISTPSGDYKVDAVRVADVIWNGEIESDNAFIVQQHVVGAITWPDYIPPPILQPFQVVLAPQNDETIDPDSIQIVKGDVLWNNSRGVNINTEGLGQFYAPLQGQVRKAWVYPEGSLTAGSDYESPFINNGGRFHLERTMHYVCIIGNQDSFTSGSYNGNVSLAIIKAYSDAYDKTKPFNFGFMGRHWCSPCNQGGSPATGYWWSPTGYNHLWNYNCQRFIIARVYHNEVNWVVDQRMYGPVTLPNDLIPVGNYNPPFDSPYPVILTTQYQEQQDAWGGSWGGHVKDGNPDDCTIITDSYTPPTPP